jgi:hypothetical protein
MNKCTAYSFISNSVHPEGYNASMTQTGQVTCGSGSDGIIISVITFLWVSLLVILHILLSVVLTSLGAIWIRQVEWIDSNYKKLAYSPSLMVAAMPVLAVAAATEVAQHVFDNWLYLGLNPSFYLAGSTVMHSQDKEQRVQAISDHRHNIDMLQTR